MVLECSVLAGPDPVVYPYLSLPMPSPNSPILQQLDSLNRSSPWFLVQLSNVLCGQEYTRSVPNFQDDDLVWLVDYLDNVRRCIALPQSLLKPT